MDRLSDARALLPWQAGCIRLDTLTVEALLCVIWRTRKDLNA